MKLLTVEVRQRLPRLYSQEKTDDPIVNVKFFTPRLELDVVGHRRRTGWR